MATPLWQSFFAVPGGYQEQSYTSSQWTLTGTAASGYAGYTLAFTGSFTRPPAGGVPTGNITGFIVYNPAGTELYEGNNFSQSASMVVSNPSSLLDAPLQVLMTGGNDNFVGGGKQVVIVDSAGSDTITGGAGGALISFRDLSFGITIDLSSTERQNSGLGQLTLRGVTGIQGTSYADHITGSASNDAIYGSSGADQIDSGSGDDTILLGDYGGSALGAVAHGGDGNDSLATWYDGTLYGDAGNDVFRVGMTVGFRGVFYGGTGNTLNGGDGNDAFVGWAAGNILSGGAGSDTFQFRDYGFDYIGHSSVDGGADYDALDVAAAAVGDPDTLSIYLGGGAPDGPGVIDALNVEELRVSAAVGGGLLSGWPNPAVYVYGGAENDIVKGSGAGGIHIDGGGGSDYLSGTEGGDYIAAGSGADTLLGNGGDDALRPGGGIDVVDGGAGSNRMILAGANASYQVIALGDHYYLFGAGERVQVSNVESVAFDDGAVSWQSLADRAVTFDSLRYLASYPDLIRAFGNDAAAAAQHFIDFGFGEGRAITFDPLAYAAASPDLASALGTDAVALENHYIDHGLAEGRPTSGFDDVAYLLSNHDLAGFTPYQAELHWLNYGADEGRTGDSLFGREQASHQLFADHAALDTLETAVDRDWFALGTTPTYAVDIHLSGASSGGSSLGAGRLELYDATGHLLASASAAAGHSDVDLLFQAAADGPALYYVVVAGEHDAANWTYAVGVQGTINTAAASVTHYDDLFLV
ncbi:MAG: calcium-binding protein [Sphingomonas sp.]